jgi:hypothetical protein
MPRMFTNHLFAGSDIDAVNLVGSYIAKEPLDCRSEVIESAARFLRYGPDFVRRRISNTRNVALDDVPGHALIRSFFLV